MTRGFVGVLLAGSLVFSSTAAVGATASAPAPINPWAALTAMSGAAPAAALCGAAAAAAAGQAGAGCVLPAVDTPPPVAQSGPPAPIPVPPVESAGGFALSPLVLALGALAAGALLYFLVIKKDKDNEPNSPA
jgi:hypothetical protein